MPSRCFSIRRNPLAPQTLVFSDAWVSVAEVCHMRLGPQKRNVFKRDGHQPSKGKCYFERGALELQKVAPNPVWEPWHFKRIML